MSTVKRVPGPLVPTAPAMSLWVWGKNVFTLPLETLPRRGVAWLHELSTPALLRLLLGALALSSLLFGCAAFWSLDVQRQNLRSFGRESVPALLQAHRIKAALVALDTDLVQRNVRTLVHPHLPATTNPAFREKLGDALLEAATTLKGIPGEREALFGLQRGLGVYNSLAAEAGNQHLRTQLIPAADRLILSRQTALERTHELQIGAQNLAACGVLLAILLLGGLLVLSQRMLFQRTRRVLNPGLVAATVLTCIFTLGLSASLVQAADTFNEVREKNLAALSTLLQARAMAHEVSSLEGHWLLATTSNRQHTTDPNSFENQMFGLRALLGPALQADTLERSLELSARTRQAFNDYDLAYEALESASREGDTKKALLGNTDYAANAFEKFDAALQTEIDQRSAELAQRVEASTHSLGQQRWVFVLGAFAIVLSTLLGFLPRLREYAF